MAAYFLSVVKSRFSTTKICIISHHSNHFLAAADFFQVFKMNTIFHHTQDYSGALMKAGNLIMHSIKSLKIFLGKKEFRLSGMKRLILP